MLGWVISLHLGHTSPAVSISSFVAWLCSLMGNMCVVSTFSSNFLAWHCYSNNVATWHIYIMWKFILILFWTLWNGTAPQYCSLSPDNRDTAKSMKTSWRVTTRRSPAPNPDWPRPFQSPTQRLALRLLSSLRWMPTTKTRGPETSDKRGTHRKSYRHTTSTSFQSRTLSQKKLSLTSRQKVLQGTESVKGMCAKCRGWNKDECACSWQKQFFFYAKHPLIQMLSWNNSCIMEPGNAEVFLLHK